MPQPYPQPGDPRNPSDYEPPRPRPHGRGKVRRFFHGYLLLAGAAATIYLLVLLIIRLLVELGHWM